MLLFVRACRLVPLQVYVDVWCWICGYVIYDIIVVLLSTTLLFFLSNSMSGSENSAHDTAHLLRLFSQFLGTQYSNSPRPEENPPMRLSPRGRSLRDHALCHGCANFACVLNPG